MTLCDTNVFIYAFNGRKDTIDKLTEIGLTNIVLSSVCVMELYRGMSNAVELAQLKKKIKYFDVWEINNDVSKLATKLIENYRLSHGLQIPDAFIGATAIVHQTPLFTYNIKDFHFMPGIKII